MNLKSNLHCTTCTVVECSLLVKYFFLWLYCTCTVVWVTSTKKIWVWVLQFCRFVVEYFVMSTRTSKLYSSRSTYVWALQLYRCSWVLFHEYKYTYEYSIHVHVAVDYFFKVFITNFFRNYESTNCSLKRMNFKFSAQQQKSPWYSTIWWAFG